MTNSRPFHDPEYPSPENLSDRQKELVGEFNAGMGSGSIAMEEVPCLCGGEEFSLLAEYDRYRIRQRSVICAACGLIQSVPRMSSAETERFYSSDTYRRLYNPEVFDLDRAGFDGYVERAAYRHKFVTRCLESKTIARVLEIGCGGGWNLWPYKQDGASITGYDYGPALVAFGCGLGMDLRTGSAADVTESGFDLIVLSHVIEHFLDPVRELEKLIPRLAGEGHIYIEVPNARQFCLGALQNAHTYFFSPATLAHYMARAGLELIESENFGPHVGALFQPKTDLEPPDLAGEFASMGAVIRKHDRRERMKQALDSMGVLALTRSAASLVRRKASPP